MPADKGTNARATGHLIPLVKHLYVHPDGSYVIRNSSRKKIKNRRTLRVRYLINLHLLVEYFEEHEDVQMDIRYLNLYSYRFLKGGDGIITVYKIIDGREPFLWGHYPIGELKNIEWELMSRIEMPEPHYSRSDLFENLVHYLQAKHCIYCRSLIQCRDDTEFLIKWEKRAEREKGKLGLASLEVLPICIECIDKIKLGRLDLNEVLETIRKVDE